MSALIRALRNNDRRSSIIENGRIHLEAEVSTSNVTVFDPTVELRYRQANNRISALEVEVASLHHELHEAERTINLLEQLLRNMQIREQEFRRELASSRF
jgi:hypothetical protein